MSIHPKPYMSASVFQHCLGFGPHGVGNCSLNFLLTFLWFCLSGFCFWGLLRWWDWGRLSLRLMVLLLLLFKQDLVIRSSSSSSSPDSLGNGPAPCLGASLRPVVWLASRESEEASSQVVEPAHSALRSLDLEWLLTLDSVVTPPWPAMPFGLKLRRTRRYNVLSKNYFVTRIRLLDNNVIECTLSVESTGQECLEAVAQRLELREVSPFSYRMIL